MSESSLVKRDAAILDHANKLKAEGRSIGQDLAATADNLVTVTEDVASLQERCALISLQLDPSVT